MSGRHGTRALLAALLMAASACRNFGEPPPPALSVSPESLSFVGAADGQSPPARVLSIGRLGGGNLAWTARADAPWLSVSPVSDTAPAVASVSVATGGLAVGRYSGAIALTAPGAAVGRLTVPVTLVLTANMTLTGRWTGTSDVINLTLSLVQSGDSVTGTGTLNPPLRAVTVAGAYRSPVLTLTMTAPDGTVTTYGGSWVGDNAFGGTLDGPGISNVQISLFRQ